jgi:hypothetical protein
MQGSLPNGNRHTKTHQKDAQHAPQEQNDTQASQRNVEERYREGLSLYSLKATIKNQYSSRQKSSSMEYSLFSQNDPSEQD